MNNITIKSGNTKVIIVTVRNTTGNPINLTGATIKYQVARKINETTKLITKEIGSGIVVSNPTSGSFNILLGSADTVALDPCSYYHEALLSQADGTVSTVLSGNLIIEPSLVKP